MQLVFVYNADAGLFSALSDYAHKLISPETYACSLCAMTYGHLGMKRAWRRFVEEMEAEVEFLHRDELAERYGLDDVALPAIFEKAEGGLAVWMDAETLDACADLETLVGEVRTRLASIARRAPAC